MDYTEIAADVLAALQEDGFAVTLRRPSDQLYQPAAGEYAYAESTDYDAWALIASRAMLSSGQIGDRKFPGTMIQTGDKELILAAPGLEITPKSTDLLVISGVAYQIISMIPVEPGGVVLFYRVLVRK